MLAVVKKPHIEINAEEIPEKLIKFLTDNYSKVEIINNDDELVDIRETAWYRERANISKPGQVLKRYRKRNGLSQTELGEKLGIAKQNISAMERGSRGISKAIAHELSDIFQVSPGRFI
ncbi:helix-turn-helix transcriptional regulator [Oceanispirochaeta sp.]|jgi:DNA-binding XRE family transcriptional regulator|uniref:helix-turn-helix domain-containing protein n=1 Tax=Oceanispirochaeta sp. TaxID=2035350 RepID=UPI00260EEC65|nr:helix-turn-helix transcriptional regulator [Oceanispirochaeta sp.]MDA3957937.1 helix-turn-helix transcriptional regulator [Oceanispirochaeta sp.]